MRLGEALSARGLVCAVLCSAGADAAFFKASQDKSSQVFLFPSHSLLFSSNYLPTPSTIVLNSEGTQAIFLKFVSLHGGVSFSTYHVCVRVLYASVRLSSHPLSESQSLSVDSHLHC